MEKDKQPSRGVYTSVYATSELRAQGFSHMIVNLETKQVVAAIAGEQYANVTSDAMNEKC